MTTYQIRHITEYNYEEPASLSYNEAHLLPRSMTTFLYEQQVIDAHIEIEPGWNDYRERLDFYGNRVLYYTIRQAHEQTRITANCQVKISPSVLSDIQHASTQYVSTQQEYPAAGWIRQKADTTEPWEEVAVQLHSKDALLSVQAFNIRQFCLPSPFIPHLKELQKLASVYFVPQRPVVEAAQSLMEGIFTDFDFVPEATDIATPLSDVLRHRQGVCQDFAHLMVGALRTQGLAARYMSGYIETVPPPGEVKLEGADASHAWCSLYVPSLGWIDFDPTNNLVPTDQHIILGWGRDFGDVSPVKGVFYGGSQQNLNVSVDMKRIDMEAT
ncbi:MAG: transglutaminase family protein [Chloroflexota bacterium]